VVHDPAECKFDVNERIKTDNDFKSKRKNTYKGGSNKKLKSKSPKRQRVLQEIFNESSGEESSNGEWTIQAMWLYLQAMLIL